MANFNKDIARHYNTALEVVSERKRFLRGELNDADSLNHKTHLRVERVLTREQKQQERLRELSFNDILEQFEESTGGRVRVDQLLNPQLNPLSNQLFTASRAINYPKK